MNLYKEYQRLNKSKEGELSNRRMVSIVLITILILNIILLILTIEKTYLVKQTQKKENYLKSEMLLENYKRAKEQEEAFVVGQELKIKLESINNTFDEKKQFNPLLIKNIIHMETLGLSVKTINYSNGRVLLNYESSTLKDSLDYMENLRKSGLIKDLRYQGYTTNKSMIQGQVEIILEGGY